MCYLSGCNHWKNNLFSHAIEHYDTWSLVVSLLCTNFSILITVMNLSNVICEDHRWTSETTLLHLDLYQSQVQAPFYYYCIWVCVLWFHSKAEQKYRSNLQTLATETVWWDSFNFDSGKCGTRVSSSQLQWMIDSQCLLKGMYGYNLWRRNSFIKALQEKRKWMPAWFHSLTKNTVKLSLNHRFFGL